VCDKKCQDALWAKLAFASFIDSKTAPGPELSVSQWTEDRPAISTSRGDKFLPDFLTIQASVAIPNPWTFTLVGVTGQLSLDRYGAMYAGLGPNVGKSATILSGSVHAGWVTNPSIPNPNALQGFMTAHSVRVTSRQVVEIESRRFLSSRVIVRRGR
jgi:hypothetical protein